MTQPDSIAVKTCRKCLTDKPRSEYYKEKGCIDGLRPQCKDCCGIRRRNGKPRTLTIIRGHPYLTIIARLFEKISINPEIAFRGVPCWMWTASKDKKGYAQFGIGNTWQGRCHRITYKMFVGPIPEGLQVDHLCKRTSCVNPVHLEAVTGDVNYHRGDNTNANKTHCKRGHEFTPENTYVRKGIGTNRSCRACRVIKGREFRERHPGYHDKYWKKS